MKTKIEEFTAQELKELCCKSRTRPASFIADSFFFDSILEHPEEEFESYRKTTSTTGSTPQFQTVVVSDHLKQLRGEATVKNYFTTKNSPCRPAERPKRLLNFNYMARVRPSSKLEKDKEAAQVKNQPGLGTCKIEKQMSVTSVVSFKKSKFVKPQSASKAKPRYLETTQSFSAKLNRTRAPEQKSLSKLTKDDIDFQGKTTITTDTKAAEGKRTRVPHVQASSFLEIAAI